MKRKAYLFALHGGTSRHIAVSLLPFIRPFAIVVNWMIAFLLAAGSIVGLNISAMAQEQARFGASVLSMGSAVSAAQLVSRLTQDQGPEQEQALTFTANSIVSTPTAIRTDRKIKTLLIHIRVRVTNGGTGPTLRTAPPLLNTQVFGLIQQITLRGQSQRYGSQNIVQMRGEDAAEYMALLFPNYVPYFTVAQNGAAPVRGGALDIVAAHTNDIELVLPVPLYPPGINGNDIPFYCLHGPDWPGNLYVDVQLGDGTSLATANAPVTFANYGGGGSGVVNILTERPLLGKGLMARIKPVLTFRQNFSGQPTATVSGVSGSGIKLSDLVVGKDTTRVFLKTGTASAAATAGTVNFGSLLDSIVTRTFPSLDVRNLRFQPANGDGALQDYLARKYTRTVPIGYKVIDYIAVEGQADANPKAAFPSSKLTAARKWELDGDVVAAANQIANVVQEMTLGTPGLLNG
jgi:hypothetical protein